MRKPLAEKRAEKGRRFVEDFVGGEVGRVVLRQRLTSVPGSGAQPSTETLAKEPRKRSGDSFFALGLRNWKLGGELPTGRERLSDASADQCPSALQ